MSTISKLDPRVRRARRDRKEVVASLARVISQLSGHRAFAAAAVHVVLVEIARNPTITGTRKNVLFDGLIKRLQEIQQPQQVAA